MGSWGAGLYASDVALDVRGDFALWARIPGSVEALVERVVDRHPAARLESDEDYPEVWLALADQLHAHGLEHAEAFRRARHAITSGLDLAAKRSLGLRPGDERKRKAMLDGLLARWDRPHPRPRRRVVLKAPEPQAFAAGTIVAYPTCGGVPRNYADVSNRLGWFGDGWGSAIILATGHARGWFGWTGAGRLDVHGGDKPTLEACLSASIENQPWFMEKSGKGTIAVQVEALPPLHARRMEMEALGVVQLDPQKVARLHPEIAGHERVPVATLHDVLTWRAAGVKPHRRMEDPGIAFPAGVMLLSALLSS